MLRAQTAKVSLGIAWDVRGIWQVDGTAATLRGGDAVQPGSLLLPSASASDHSITILLPDGQRILCECFTAKDCARGFRVPSLFRAPEPFAAEMLGRIRAALVQQRGQTAALLAKEPRIARDEAVAVPGPENRIEIGGLAAALSNGEYFGDLRSFDARYPQQSGIPLEKSGRSIALTVPGPGLFLLTIIDSMKRPRIEFMIAVEPVQDSSVTKDFQEAHALMKEWREDFFNWPMHDFQRAFLQSLMLNIRPVPGSKREMERTDAPQSGVTAEPIFTPKPGVLEGDTAVTLQCATPGAVIHYTVDGSQPLENSPVYHAPILMKRVPLRIKACAESPGKRDSPVVTGNFRIQGQKD
ncbi:MAG TPA: FN3 associated domain-containing protein [Terracidiphilus sp.]|nr:FN3 associated domain-containing protein [Terracidiphilus sp.]